MSLFVLGLGCYMLIGEFIIPYNHFLESWIFFTVDKHTRVVPIILHNM